MECAEQKCQKSTEKQTGKQQNCWLSTDTIKKNDKIKIIWLEGFLIEINSKLSELQRFS